MKSIRKITGTVIAATLIIVLSATASPARPAAQGILSDADFIALTSGHSRTIAFNLDSPVGGEAGLHAAFITTYGAGSLKIIIANHASLDMDDELIYFVAGFIGATPVLQYSYSTATIQVSVDATEVDFGVLFTGILYAFNGPEFPVTMSMLVSLQ